MLSTNKFLYGFHKEFQDNYQKSIQCDSVDQMLF